MEYMNIVACFTCIIVTAGHISMHASDAVNNVIKLIAAISSVVCNSY